VAALAMPALAVGGDTAAGFAAAVGLLVVGMVVTCVSVREPQGALTLDPARVLLTGQPPGSLKRAEGPPAAQGETGLGWALRFSPREHPDFCWMLGGRLCFIVALTTIQTFALFYLRDVLRPPDYLALWRDLTAAIGVAILVVAYPAGWIADRLGRRLVL